MIKYVLLIILLCSALLSCRSDDKTNHDSSIINTPDITIKYDYSKGFSFDSLNLFVDKKIFAAAIDSIYNQHIEFYEGYYASKQFKNIFDHSESYLNNVLLYIKDFSNSKSKTEIAILTIGKSDFATNLNFLYACDWLYKKNLLDEEMFPLIFYPPIDLQNLDIIKNYKHQEVQKVLMDISNNKNTSAGLKATISDILSGKSYKEKQVFLSYQYDIHI